MDSGGKDYFSALYEVARVVNASLDTNQVLNTIVECVARAVSVKACSLRLFDHRRQRLILGAVYGLSDRYIDKGPVLVSESGLDRKVLDGTTVWVENAQTDPRFQYNDKAKEEGIVSVLVIPMMHGDAVIGVLRVYSDAVRAFGGRERRFLEAAAHLSAIAVDNARLHEALQQRLDLMAAYKYRIDDN